MYGSFVIINELSRSSLYVFETLYIYLSDIEDTRFVSTTLAVTLQVRGAVFWQEYINILY